MALVTIILPTHSRALLMSLACKSILMQTMKDWELFIIGDGPTDEVIKEGQKLKAQHKNIKFQVFTKSEHNGETYRNSILTKEATGKYVLYLADDDLWTPDHIESMLSTLREKDFAHAQFLRFKDKETLEILNTDLNLNYYQEMLIAGENRIPLSCGGHSMEIYSTLSEGWRNAPKGISSDLHMWQQFLNLKNLKAGCTNFPTVLNFPNSLRSDWTELARKNEMEDWLDKFSYVDYKPQLFEMYIKALHEHTNEIEAEAGQKISIIQKQSDKQVELMKNEIDAIKASKLWKLASRFSKKKN